LKLIMQELYTINHFLPNEIGPLALRSRAIGDKLIELKPIVSILKGENAGWEKLCIYLCGRNGSVVVTAALDR